MKLSFGCYLCCGFITLLCIADILSESSAERLNHGSFLDKSGASDTTVNTLYTVNPGYSQPFSYRKWFVGWVFYLLEKAVMSVFFMFVILLILVLFGSTIGFCFPKLGFDIVTVSILIFMQMFYLMGYFIGFRV